MRLRSISAKAAWICRKARPVGVVVSIGELMAFEIDAALLQPIDQGDEVVRQPSEVVEIQNDQDIVAAHMIETGRQAGGPRIRS